LRYVRTMPELFVPLVMMAIVGTFAFNFQTVMPLLIKRTLHGNDTTFTLIYSVISVGSLVGALMSARRSSVNVRHIVWASYAFGASMLLLAVTPNVAFTYPIGILVGFTSIAFMTTSTAIVQLRSDPSMRGRVLALQAMVFLGSTPIGGPILGYASQHFGARSGVLIGGVSAIVAGAYGMRAIRFRDDAAAAITDSTMAAAR
ncbi:MAG: MFS transporter, partial [Ilumatobacteraceae bacterium]